MQSSHREYVENLKYNLRFRFLNFQKVIIRINSFKAFDDF